MIHIIKKFIFRKEIFKEDLFLDLPNKEKKKILLKVSKEADKMQSKVIDRYNYLFSSGK
jgi:hypothetical protein